MTCRGFRKFVGVFADGELDARANAEALEHLNMCPSCAARVADVQRMKAALGQVLGRELAPAGLAERIHRLVCKQQPVEPPTKSGLVRMLYAPMALAAALLLIVTVWQFRESFTHQPVPTGTMTVIGMQTATEVSDQHVRCSAEGLKHHDVSLGRDLPGIARKLTARLKLAVIAPDLSDYDLTLLGAGACGVRGRPGGHVLYQGEDGCRVSVFSIASSDCGPVTLDHVRQEAGLDFAVAQRNGLSIVGWTQECATYLCCGDLPAEEVLQIASSARKQTHEDL